MIWAGRLGIRSFSGRFFAFFFALLALTGRSFLVFFLGRSFSRISYPRTSSNSAGKSASPDRRRFDALGFLSFGGFCLKCLPADLEVPVFSPGCSPSPPTMRRFRRYFRKVTRNCERLSPEMPMRATNATGSAVRHKAIMRAVNPNGRNKKTGVPMANARMPASITFRARNIPPKKVPVSMKFGGMI